MSEIANREGASEPEKPVHNDVTFPPFPDPTDEDFDDDISEEERNYYKTKFKDLHTIKTYRLHCSACDRHMGCSVRNERMRAHPLLRTLVCHSCHTFYNSGEFEKGDDGSELYCRWCGQGGQVYCCSDCPHVFCAKCIKRNLGKAKIKEIENADDWKCFKCNPQCLRDLRAICWAFLRYCDLKNKITYQTQDAELKAAYQKECAIDDSECCRHKSSKRNQRSNESLNKKKEVKKETTDPKVAAVISKMPSTIQVKKFASVPIEEATKPEVKKGVKRSISPKNKSILVKNPITIAPCQKVINPICVPPLAKKIRLPNCSISTPIRFPNIAQERKPIATYTRIRPKITSHVPIPIANNCFNGFSSNLFQCNNNPINDNINLSLESLTQGLDMAAVAALSNNSQNNNDDVVCTPDFPLEPLCEVTEDNDDDVECITPGPVTTPKLSNPPPLILRHSNPVGVSTPDIMPENIIQMTENDVTVNESTGGLKFRVDPQTLSSNKMYRLPDGRIFAINANPNMPGGYSATIVAVTEANKTVPKGATFAAKLSSVTTSTPSTSTSAAKSHRNQVTRFISSKRSTPKSTRSSKTSETSARECDLNVPIEWYRYNLIDAVDALEYSLSRLNKLKKEATSVYLRSRSVHEMRSLHRTLERLLNTSTSRFNEIRDNLNKGLKQYVAKKTGADNSSDEDDDVEILPDVEEDPIFIDENSLESNINGSENQEVDLTGPGSSEYNDSGENRNDSFSKGEESLQISENENDHVELLKILNKRKEKKKNDDQEENINGTEKLSKDNESSVLTVEDLKCRESIKEINGVTEKSSNKADDKSKTDDEEGETLDKNVNEKAVSKDSDDNLEDPDEKSANDNEKVETIMDDDKMDISDIKMEDFSVKINDSADKIDDSGDKIQDADDKIQDADDKIQNSDDKIQLNELDDKTQDSEDKQDTEMSEEMIETLLKDDNSRGNSPTTEVPEALQIT